MKNISDYIWEIFLQPSETDPSKAKGQVIAEIIENHPKSSKQYKERARRLREIINASDTVRTMDEIIGIVKTGVETPRPWRKKSAGGQLKRRLRALRKRDGGIC